MITRRQGSAPLLPIERYLQHTRLTTTIGAPKRTQAFAFHSGVAEQFSQFSSAGMVQTPRLYAGNNQCVTSNNKATFRNIHYQSKTSCEARARCVINEQNTFFLHFTELPARTLPAASSSGARPQAAPGLSHGRDAEESDRGHRYCSKPFGDKT